MEALSEIETNILEAQKRGSTFSNEQLVASELGKRVRVLGVPSCINEGQSVGATTEGHLVSVSPLTVLYFIRDQRHEI
jgi:hypothetical protein